MSSHGSRPWFASFRARIAKPGASRLVRSDGLTTPAADPAEWPCLEDATSRWLRATQGVELG